MDASGLISVLSGPGPTLPGRKLTQLAQMNLIRMPDAVHLEATKKNSAAKQWLARNNDSVVVAETPEIVRHQAVVRERCSSLKGFLRSAADVMVVCTALELNKIERRVESGVRHVVVAVDGQLEAACFTFGIDRISPNAFVQLFGSAPLL